MNPTQYELTTIAATLTRPAAPAERVKAALALWAASGEALHVAAGEALQAAEKLAAITAERERDIAEVARLFAGRKTIPFEEFLKYLMPQARIEDRVRRYKGYLRANVRYCGEQEGKEPRTKAAVEADVEAAVEADVEAAVEADVEAAVEAAVEADVEAAVEVDVEAAVEAVVEKIIRCNKELGISQNNFMNRVRKIREVVDFEMKEVRSEKAHKGSEAQKAKWAKKEGAAIQLEENPPKPKESHLEMLDDSKNSPQAKQAPSQAKG